MDTLLMHQNAKIQRVFLYTGNVIHLIDVNEPRPPTQASNRCTTFCGYTPIWPAGWFFVDDPDWEDEAKSLPPCLRCENVRRAKENAGPTAA